ncbi:MAG: MoxR family ATPase [Lachnospiraceae bacterium]|nr:MoxR family ATPase [Lachnospiraceae bacterium]
MNIKDAKKEIVNTVHAYLQKDETGSYVIPVERQRPVLLIGPPGIGKTAIMEQVAQECGINLVSYTITHHTRQSAIGLPFISKKNYGGEEIDVTEYTMSEIIAAIYEQIERSGIKEGILFLDEINCVSETLAPTMLQFLQYKTFGNHRVPDGFVIVTAGNPPEYNKSVRDFDIVTYDRVKRIYVEEDFAVWKEYAYRARIHGAILSYLEIKKKNFYSIVSDLDGKRFVTARGWEDLSQVMKVYENLGLPINFDFVVQYLQDEEIARDFANYYELYNKYSNIYRIPEILDGEIPENTIKMQNAPFDEKLSLLGLLLDRLGQEFCNYAYCKGAQSELLAQLNFLRSDLKEGKGSAKEILERQISSYSAMLSHKKKAGMLTREDEKAGYGAANVMQEFVSLLALQGTGQAKEDFLLIKNAFDGKEAERQQAIADTGRHLSNAFSFLARVFGEGQEMVIFLSELSCGYYSLKFVSECGNEEYYKYNRLLLLKDRREELKEEIMQLKL